jgi:GNAT superfamily N-acetyltransferase
MIEDGSTLQMGIGTIPDAVLACLTDKKDLGIHTEMFSDGVIPLVESGVINGRRKNIRQGKIVSSFVLGSHRLYDWLHDNPMVEFHPTEYTNDPFRIAQHDKMIAINSALEIDLTGQVCADSLGTYFYSGIGGQVDFIRGASRSRGGKPIIALPATAQHGAQSRIVSALKPGAGVVTSRGDVHYVVTEFGVADLHGKSIRERVLALVHIAHPDFRDQLMEEARRRKLVPPDQVAVRLAGTPEIESLTTRFTTRGEAEILLRPVHPTDEEPLREAFYNLSPTTLYQRFHGVVKFASRKRFRDVTIFDPEKSMVIVGVHHEGERDVIVAAARYDQLPGTADAVAGILVADEWQGKGVGTRLLQHLMDIARRRRIATFIANVFPDNAAILHVFQKCSAGEITSTLKDNIYRLRIPLTPEPVPAHKNHTE